VVENFVFFCCVANVLQVVWHCARLCAIRIFLCFTLRLSRMSLRLCHCGIRPSFFPATVWNVVPTVFHIAVESYVFASMPLCGIRPSYFSCDSYVVATVWYSKPSGTPSLPHFCFCLRGTGSCMLQFLFNSIIQGTIQGNSTIQGTLPGNSHSNNGTDCRAIKTYHPRSSSPLEVLVFFCLSTQ
jgi:hypothetical protein